ncbi:MAG TPA: 3-ketoacyl-ACP reductase [Vicinamibacterales bacterium]|nr:3-ketoacyl-ACP reductase [Vicinamibacterales bacterium]
MAVERSSRAALVTGGTRGIGLGIARALAREGWDLALCGVRPADAIRGVIPDLQAAGAATVEYFQADLGIREDRVRLAAEVCSRFDNLYALVNNAGRAPRVRADLLEATEESFEELMRTNLQGPYFLTQAIARQMIARGTAAKGAIVFITSVSAEMVSPNRGEYCVSKAGLSMAARLFAVRLAPCGIPVYEVRPGTIDTDMTAALRHVYDRRITDGLVPEGRWGYPDDVGRAVAALLRGDVPYATGTVIHVDGGLSVPRL